MPESFASSEDLGFIALSLPTGGSIWLAAASIYAVETNLNEHFSTVKTVGEAVGVLESPEVIFNTIEAIQRNAAHREERRSVEKFADFVSENSLKVYGVEDPASKLFESDLNMKELRKRGLAANAIGEPLPDEDDGFPRRVITADGQEISPKAFMKFVQSLGGSEEEGEAILGAFADQEAAVRAVTDPEFDYDSMSEDHMRRVLREQGVDEGTIETIIRRRADERFESEAEQEFGEDLGGVLNRMRKREEGERG